MQPTTPEDQHRARDIGLGRERPSAASPSTLDDFLPSESSALFIGIREFTTDDRLAPIEFAVDDAVDLAHAFSMMLGHVPPTATHLCLSGSPQKPESQARLEALREAGAIIEGADQSTIYRALETQVRRCGRNGLFLVGVATHGFQKDGVDYLVAANSLRSRIERTGISLSEVLDESANAAALRRLALLDACRERLETGTRAVAASEQSAMSESFTRAMAGARGQAVLAAASPGGYAYDDPTVGNGVFTRALLDGIQGAAPPDAQGLITVESLAKFANERVAEWVRKNVRGNVAGGGISYNLSGDAARLPLADHPTARGTYKAYLMRREHLIGVLGQAMRYPALRADIVEEVREFLSSCADPVVAEPAFRRLERIEREGVEAAEDFANWWRSSGKQKQSEESSPHRDRVPPPKSETAAWEAFSRLEEVVRKAPVERQAVMWESFSGEWVGTAAAGEAHKALKALKTHFNTAESASGVKEHLAEDYARQGLLDLAMHTLSGVPWSEKVCSILLEIARRYEQVRDISGARAAYGRVLATDPKNTIASDRLRALADPPIVTGRLEALKYTRPDGIFHATTFIVFIAFCYVMLLGLWDPVEVRPGVMAGRGPNIVESTPEEIEQEKFLVVFHGLFFGVVFASIQFLFNGLIFVEKMAQATFPAKGGNARLYFLGLYVYSLWMPLFLLGSSLLPIPGTAWSMLEYQNSATPSFGQTFLWIITGLVSFPLLCYLSMKVINKLGFRSFWVVVTAGLLFAAIYVGLELDLQNHTLYSLLILIVLYPAPGAFLGAIFSNRGKTSNPT